MTDPTFTLRNVNSYLIFTQLAIWSNVCTSPERNRIDLKLNAITNLISTTYAVFKNNKAKETQSIDVKNTILKFNGLFDNIKDLRENYEFKLEQNEITSIKEIEYTLIIDELFKVIIDIIVTDSLIQSDKLALEWSEDEANLLDGRSSES